MGTVTEKRKKYLLQIDAIAFIVQVFGQKSLLVLVKYRFVMTSCQQHAHLCYGSTYSAQGGKSTQRKCVKERTGQGKMTKYGIKKNFLKRNGEKRRQKETKKQVTNNQDWKQCEMQQGGKGELLGGWVQAALVSGLPQVVSHHICFLVELPSMDTFLPHDKNQCWSTQRKKNKINEQTW